MLSFLRCSLSQGTRTKGFPSLLTLWENLVEEKKSASLRGVFYCEPPVNWKKLSTAGDEAALCDIADLISRIVYLSNPKRKRGGWERIGVC